MTPPVLGHSTADIERAAADVLSPAVWDFIDGGSGDERTVRANRTSLDAVSVTPRVLAGVGEPVTSTELLGCAAAHPIAVAPMAYQGLVHPGGEAALAMAAQRTGIPYVASTLSSVPIEEIAKVGAGTCFQLYWLRDRGQTRELITRAELSGCRSLMVTVDLPIMARRLRDLANGFAVPAGIPAANLTAGAAGEGAQQADGARSPREHTRFAFDPTLSWRDLEWVRDQTDLPLVVKGILDPRDAERAVALGAASLVVSNHGGRQLDGAVPSIVALPDVVDAVADRCQVLFDSGVRTGTDIMRALALGAAGVLVGRPLLFGLAIDGARSAVHVIDLLHTELRDAMMLAGCQRIADVRALTTHVDGAVATRRGRAGGRGDARGGNGASSVLQPDIDIDDLHGSLRDPGLESMNLLNEIAERYPDAVSFAAGRPTEQSFDPESIHDNIRRYCRYLRDDLGFDDAGVRRHLYQYGPTKGVISPNVARNLLVDEGITVDPGSIVVTVGCQEGMFLVLRALRADERDVALAASPTYVGFTGAARLVDMPVIDVASGPTGLDLEDLVEKIGRARRSGLRPRLCYVVPDFANPDGVRMPIEARRRLLAIAAQEGVLLLEDNPYGIFCGNAPRIRTLKALDTGRHVVYLGSYAKTMLPGARVGFVVADQWVRTEAGRPAVLADHLSKIKSMVTVNTSPIAQAVVAGGLLSHHHDLVRADEHLRRHYAARLEQLKAGLRRRFPGGDDRGAPGATRVTWNEPAGGFFVVVAVPFTADDAMLEHSARVHGVLWTPMSHFFAGAGGTDRLRLAVSSVSSDDIETGLDRLADLVQDVGAGRPP